MSSYSRKQPVRRSVEPRVAVHHPNLQSVRDGIPPAPDACAAAPSGAVLPAQVPAELLAVVEEFARHMNRHLAEAVRVGGQYANCRGEWQRLVLYALTDSLAYNSLVVGTIAAYLQQHEIDDDLLRRHLQSPSPDRYVTQEALDLLAGLLGSLPANAPEREAVEPTWTSIGRQIAQRAAP
ncbi:MULTISPECIES: hypothetical protein [unclassified Streptomyces]|uniref:hypothetical protein n=1 Tax=unclassified Streptomyces TaxID=2593676 RepID=UPI000DB93C21|nr:MULTISPECIES: hypothetical protein [unclassified Streptomyces]MYT68315.1 hypothetical protein [Streptomyces sp. SID8367]RAJ76951.1 hypothetical protein K377_06120 [Streptomyces sp. PsTaAH-137]